MNAFSKLHPVLQLMFYLSTFLITLLIQNPIFSAVSLIGALLYGAVQKGKRILKSLAFALVVIVAVSLFNTLFAHYGVDVLFKIGDTEFTLEALFYGFNQGLVLSAMLIWFTILSENTNSERVAYLFRLAPKTALLFSMVLGFIPRFNKKLKDIRDAQRALNGGREENSIKTAVNNLSALISYSLEGSIITADSMKARGYNPKAQMPSRYKFELRDIILITVVVLSAVVVFEQKLVGEIHFIFEPRIYSESFSTVAVICFILLELLPSILEVYEEFLWKLSNARA